MFNSKSIVSRAVYGSLVFCLASASVLAQDSEDEAHLSERSLLDPWRKGGCEATRTDSYAEYIKPGWEALTSYPGNKQKVIISSDPQPFRYMVQRNSYNEDTNQKEWEKRSQVYDAIREERQQNYYVPVVVNGDITEYGHGNERKAVQKMFKRMSGRIGGPLLLPGLGNHDYSNNLGSGSCKNNGCPRDAVCDHIKWVSAIKPKNSFDYRFDGRNHKGSLAYSVTVGRVHIVQLNNEPTYKRSWETGGGITAQPKRGFDITPSLDWLENDLAEAHRKGLHIIVNMHRPDWADHNAKHSRFKDIVEKYKVTAVFFGHLHNTLGRRGSIGKVPVFHSGGLLAGSYLRVTFDWSHMKMLVDTVTMDNSKNQQSVIDIPYRGHEGTASVTFYERAGLQGRSCSFGLSRGDTKAVSNADSDCKALNINPRSAKVDNFSPGDRLCFLNADGDRSRCYTGSYRGSFPVANFDLGNDVPRLEREARGYPMNGHVRRVSFD